MQSPSLMSLWLAASCVFLTFRISLAAAVDLHASEGLAWSMCPYGEAPPTELSECMKAIVPGTVFTTLLNNGQYNFSDPYYDINLQHVPDISQIGRKFYTRWFVVDLSGVRARLFDAFQKFAWLHIHGINYKSSIFINGVSVGSTLGMFKRFVFPIHLNDGPLFLQLLVEPPLYPGINVSSGKCHGGKWPAGQGGDHQIAKNGPVMQMSAGWDWIQSTPDRNTGIWDKIEVFSSGPVRLGDSHVKTLLTETGRQQILLKSAQQAEMNLSICSRIVAVLPAAIVAVFTLVDDHGLRVFEEKIQFDVDTGSSQICMPTRVIPRAKLWWPHTFGQPYLYNLSVSLEMHGGFVSDQKHLRVGFREFGKYVDNSLDGPVLTVNGHSLFLRGGNWIGTDQFLRYATDTRRYHDEVGLHAAMGLDLLRVWGGGIAERSMFYDACDEIGILVWQEFWMTGDNNGRWAGYYSWPLNHTLYIESVEDVMRTLQHRPSLMLWVAGNELYPEHENPPTDIRNAMQNLFAEDGRPFALSSMSNYTDFNASTQMAPKDGPYGMLPLEEFFTRNPGLEFWNHTRASNLKVAFNPEIGSSSLPVYSSLQRFLAPQSLAVFPDAADKASTAWAWHKYEGYNSWSPLGSNSSFNMIYNLGAPPNASEFALRAQIVQFMQYRSLFEGFSQFMWKYYSGVLMWKTQSPWPALRGFLYDWYLHPTGGFYGVREATKPAHAQFDFLTHSIAVVNRNLARRMQGVVEAEIFSLNGSHAGPAISFAVDVKANSVASLGHIPRFSDSVLLRLTLREAQHSDILSEYIVPSRFSDFGALRELRQASRMQHLKASIASAGDVSMNAPMLFTESVNVTLSGSAEGDVHLFLNAVPIGFDGAPVLPHICEPGYFHALPGEKRWIQCSARDRIQSVRIDGWNVYPLDVDVGEALII